MSPQNTSVALVPAEEESCNPSNNPWFGDVLARRMARRAVVQGGVAAAVTTALAGNALARGFDNDHDDRRKDHDRDCDEHNGRDRRIEMKFEAVPHATADVVTVPASYSVQVLIPEGTPITGSYPDYAPGDFNSGADREQQAGAHHDGMHFFATERGKAGNKSGVLCVNHENIDQPFIHPQGTATGSGGSRPDEDQVRKELASHGVSVVEIENRRGEWKVKRSRANRRITVNTPMEFTGPCRGSDLLKTKYSPKGTQTRGTLNNCANGYTPWGTYLTCEENWAGYFFNSATTGRPREHVRYGVPTATGSYGWGTRAEDKYARFNATPSTADYYDVNGAKGDYRNEPNNFGWVVEIDPFDPKSTPKKRTALGRLAHEGAWLAPAIPGRPIVVYTGDDSRGEYMYKYVSRKPYWPWSCASDDLLDDGTLYVARYNDDGTGEWIALEFGRNGLTAANGFKNQADVLVNARTAADFVGDTRMDRPEWAVVDPRDGYVYLTLTNNSGRGAGNQPVNASNPRPGNPDGHIIRWREDNGRHWSLSFKWDIFLFGGPTQEKIAALGAAAPYNADPIYAVQAFPGSTQQKFLGEEATFNSPDGLWVDYNTGLIWIQTDGYSDASRGFGNQQMLVANPDTGEVKRFLVGPVGCELTGITATPDSRTLFVNIQHPSGVWPNLNGETRPRSATLVITKDDGGLIGS